MTTTANSFAGTPSISAMDFRTSPGTILDRVDYRKESFLIERAGKPKAVLIPLSLYQYIEKARERIFTANKNMRKAFKKVNPITIEAEITKTIQQVRKHGAI